MAFPNDTVLDVLRDNTSANGGTGYIRTGDFGFEAPLMVLQKGIIKLHVDLCGNNNNVVAGRFELLLKAN